MTGLRAPTRPSKRSPIGAMQFLFYFIVSAGIGNTVLRTEIANPYTLYRLVAPIGLIAVFTLRPMFVLKFFTIFGGFFLYNLILASAYSSDYSQFFPSIVHYLYLFVLLLLMIYMKSRYADFDKQFLRFIQGFYLFLLINLLIEFIFGPYYPNLDIDETGESILRAFYWSQNDLSVVLGVIAWCALTLDKFKGLPRLAVVLFTAWAFYYNDSKAALISLVVSLTVYAIFRICAAARIQARVWFFLFATIFVSVAFLIVASSDVEIHFENDVYSLGDLLVQPITNIVTLQSSGEEWGSVNNRTDAAIFVIIEYIKSFGFGLGAGGSWLVLTLPQYELGGAKSPHNALLQFTVDFGYPVLFGYFYLAYWAVRKLFTYRLAENDRLKVMAILSFPMLGLSQSGAIVTNYFFFAAIYYIWLRGRNMTFAVSRLHSSRERTRSRTTLSGGLTVGNA